MLRILLGLYFDGNFNCSRNHNFLNYPRLWRGKQFNCLQNIISSISCLHVTTARVAVCQIHVAGQQSQITTTLFVKLTPSLYQLKYLSKCSNYVTAETTKGSGFDSITKQRLCSLFKAPRPALGPTELIIQWLREPLSLGLNSVDVNLTTNLYLASRLIILQNITVLPHTHFLGQITDLLLARITFS
jgi:hypothetical protein